MTTVKDVWGMQCPDCESDDSFKVAIRTWAHLLPTGTDEEGDHEWDANSDLMCDCGWEGKVADAKEGNEPETDPENVYGSASMQQSIEEDRR